MSGSTMATSARILDWSLHRDWLVHMDCPHPTSWPREVSSLLCCPLVRTLHPSATLGVKSLHIVATFHRTVSSETPCCHCSCPYPYPCWPFLVVDPPQPSPASSHPASGQTHPCQAAPADPT